MKLAACRPAPARFTPAPTLQRCTSSLKSPVQFLCYSPRFPSPLVIQLCHASRSRLRFIFAPLECTALLSSCPPPLQIVSKIVFAPSQRPLLKANVAARARLPRPRLSPLQPTMGHAILPQVRLPPCILTRFPVSAQRQLFLFSRRTGWRVLLFGQVSAFVF